MEVFLLPTSVPLDTVWVSQNAWMSNWVNEELGVGSMTCPFSPSKRLYPKGKWWPKGTWLSLDFPPNSRLLSFPRIPLDPTLSGLVFGGPTKAPLSTKSPKLQWRFYPQCARNIFQSCFTDYQEIRWEIHSAALTWKPLYWWVSRPSTQALTPLPKTPISTCNSS